jgi:hypothetical protein
VKTQNVTLSLPEPLLRRFRVYAAERNRSMTALMTDAIQKMMDEVGAREAAHRRMMERIHNAPDWGTGGKITWTRDEIWERTNRPRTK